MKMRRLYERTCIDCGGDILAAGLGALYCQACKDARDRVRALDNYYKAKREQGLPRRSKIGPPTRLELDAHPVAVGRVLDPDTRDRSNRPRPLTCKYGHPFDETNTRLDPSGRRVCKTCKRVSQRRRRQAEMSIATPEIRIIEPSEYWPYGIDDPLALAIARLLPDGLPEEVRADAGQQVYLEALEAGRRRLDEGSLRAAVQRAVRDAFGEYAVSIDWKREDGLSIAEQLQGPDLWI